MKFRRFTVLLAAVMVASLMLTTAQAAKKVGIAMPTKSSQRWIDDGNNMVKSLEDLGYETDP